LQNLNYEFPQTLLHHPEDTKEATNTISASGLEAQLSSGTFGGGNQTVWVKSWHWVPERRWLIPKMIKSDGFPAPSILTQIHITYYIMLDACCMSSFTKILSMKHRLFCQ
jgi:hypothetical protein